jgi:hypothetical protein
MSIFSAITGLFGGVSNGVAKVGEVFWGNEAKRDEYRAAENAAGMAQYAAEFNPRENRTRFDSLVDGLNRLMRPSMWFSVLGLFWLAPYDPIEFAEITAALSLIPEGMWTLLLVMVAFLFPSRILEKTVVKNVTKGIGVKEAKERLALAHELQKHAGTDDDLEVVKKTDNPSINEWKQKQGEL